MNHLTVIITSALIATFVVAPNTTSHVRNVEIVAHRGASLEARENTVASAKLAWAQNADAVETDIRLTKDGELIISHDDTTKRIDGKDTLISDLTLAETRALDATHRRKLPVADEKIPTLDDLIATIPVGKRLFVEIKTGTEIFPALEQSLTRMNVAPQSIVIISFNLEVLRQAHAKWPQYTTLWLVGYDESMSVAQLIEQTRQAGVTGLDLNWKWSTDASKLKQVKAAGLQLHVWTVDGAEIAQDWVDLGVDSITTNRAGWMRQQVTT